MCEYTPKLIQEVYTTFSFLSCQERYDIDQFDFSELEAKTIEWRQKLPKVYILFIRKCAPFMCEFGFTFPWSPSMTNYSSDQNNLLEI